MLFNSWLFIAFLALVLVVYYPLGHRAQNLFLLVASYVFYSAWDWRFTGLLVLSTVLDFVIARRIEDAHTQRVRNLLMALSVSVGLGILGFFKYFNFFVASAASLLQAAGLEPNLPALQIILPVGISFYTFQTLGYTIDVYRGHTRASRDFFTYALYVSYFPQLVAGPIERAGRLLPQIERRRTVSTEAVNSGVQLILWGFVKKIAVADSLATYVNPMFEDPVSLHGVQLWLGVYCFALQIYADFSGYTDIARGVSRLLGIELMVNFRQPYLSRNITEFWRRWHISLSTWLRDYLYVPLGGNRLGAVMQYRNLMLTMLIGGLWHGASWKFVIWGGLHGIYLVAHKLMTGGRKIGVEPPPRTVGAWLVYAASTLATFHLVCLTWVWFRAETFGDALAYTTGLFRLAAPLDIAALLDVGVVHALAFYGVLTLLIDLPCWYGDREAPFTAEHPWLARGLGYGAALFVLAFVRGGTTDAFIYFQF
jgi:D-alanyl-lipoteichoic acid acyltransferase DltB (MBOAT superfamily)